MKEKKVEETWGEALEKLIVGVVVLGVICLLFFGLRSCFGGKEKEMTGSPGITPGEMIVLAEDAVRKKLREPDSAQFRAVSTHIAPSKKGLMVCGEVNAKNGFGGYTGYMRFVAAGNLAFVESETDMDTVWAQVCQ